MAEDIIYKIQIDGTQENIKNLTFLQEAINELGRQKTALSKESKELAKALDEVNASTKDNNDRLKEINKSYQDGSVTQLEYEETIKAVNYTQQQNEATLQELTQRQYEVAEAQVQLKLETKETTNEYRIAEKAIIDNAKATDANSGSIEEMRVELRQAQQEYVKLSKEERENTAIGGELLKSIQEQDAALKELESSIGINQRSVGDYGKALQGTLPLMGGFGRQIQGVIGSIGEIKTAIAGFSNAQKGMAASTTATNGTLKAFRIALISTGIGAIVVALGTLIAAFLSTQRGIDAVNKVLTPLKELFNTFVGFLQNVATSAFDRLKEAINNPKQALSDILEFIKNQFIVRFKGFVKTFVAIGETIVNSWKLIGLKFKEALSNVPILGRGIDTDQLKKDLKEAEKAVKDSAKNIAKGAAEAATGIEAGRLKELYEEGSAAAKESIARGQQIAALQIEIEQAEVTLNREREKGNRLFQEQKELAQNTLLSDKERLTAAANAKKALEEVNKIEQEQLDRKIELARLNTIANDTDREQQQELQDLIAEKERAEADFISRRIELGNQANGIVKARIQLEKKAAEEERKELEKLKQDKIKLEEEFNDKRIERTIKTLELEHDLELATKDLTDEEIYNKEVELQEKIAKLRAEMAKKAAKSELDVELERIDDLEKAGVISKQEADVLKATANQKYIETIKQQDLADKVERAELDKEEKERKAEIQAEDDEKEAERVKEQEERKLEIKRTLNEIGTQAAQRFVDIQFANAERRRQQDVQREIEALNLKRQAGEISAEEFDKRREAIDRRAFDRKKRQDTAQALINGAVAVTKTFSSLGYPAGIIPAILAAGQTAIEVATIQSQSFAKGGFTGSGFGQADSSGFKVAGVVHEGEYVVPKHVLESGRASSHIAALEGMRRNKPSRAALGFANGGATSNIVIGGGFENLQQQIIDGVRQANQTVKVVNVSSETAEVANRVTQIQDSSTF